MFEQRKRKKLEKHKSDTLSAIRGERLAFEEMLQRPRGTGDAAPDEEFLKSVRERLAEIEGKTQKETNIDELDSLSDDAEQQGQLRAYICPREEIEIEGSLAIDVMEEWNIPRTVLANLHKLLNQSLQRSDKNPEVARCALRAIFQEKDSWDEYTSSYEDDMRDYTRWLFVVTILLLLLALVALHFSPTFLGGLLLAGAAGSCVSVMAKMPFLVVSLSGERESYVRRILSRIGAGVAASLIGCALLGWGLISFAIQGQSFPSVINDCSAFPLASCTALKTLILLGVPMLFGFSERALTSFESKAFGKSRQEPGARGARR